MKFSPNAITYEVLLTAQTAISHHDPAVQDDSNRLLFNRQPQILGDAVRLEPPSQVTLDAVAAAFPVATDIADIFEDLSFPEFVAAALAKTFMDMYNDMDGTGVFSGMERYSRLEARLRQAAIKRANLRGLWDSLCNDLDVGIHPTDHDAQVLRLLSLPKSAQQSTLAAIVKDYRSIISVARLWHTTHKNVSAEYAAKSGAEQITDMTVLHFSTIAATTSARIIEVPAISANSLRHQVVREPSMIHLFQRLGLDPASPGKGPVPAGVESILYNGGNIEAGAKQPSNVHKMANQIRDVFPTMDLLGGVTDSFDVGESRLKCAAWLVCAENKDALLGSPAYGLSQTELSVFDMVDEVTHTRQATQEGRGQMIYIFETLCKGTQVLLRLSLSPFTSDLTQGALLAAVNTFLAEDNVIGGQSARGFGHVTGEWLVAPESDAAQQEYEDYLEMNKANLISALRDGTMGAEKVVFRL